MCAPLLAALPAVGTMLGGGAAATGAAAAGTWGAMGAMAKLGMLAQVGSGIMGAVGAVQQGNAAAKAAEASAKAADNAAINAIVEGEQRAALQMRKGAKLLGQQKAAMAANGVDVGSGDALEVLDDTHGEVMADALAISTTAYNRAESYGQQAANYRTEASSAASMGRATAYTSLLGAASKVSSRWSTYAGTPGGAY